MTPAMEDRHKVIFAVDAPSAIFQIWSGQEGRVITNAYTQGGEGTLKGRIFYDDLPPEVRRPYKQPLKPPPSAEIIAFPFLEEVDRECESRNKMR